MDNFTETPSRNTRSHKRHQVPGSPAASTIARIGGGVSKPPRALFTPKAVKSSTTESTFFSVIRSFPIDDGKSAHEFAEEWAEARKKKFHKKRASGLQYNLFEKRNLKEGRSADLYSSPAGVISYHEPLSFRQSDINDLKTELVLETGHLLELNSYLTSIREAKHAQESLRRHNTYITCDRFRALLNADVALASIGVELERLEKELPLMEKLVADLETRIQRAQAIVERDEAELARDNEEKAERDELDRLNDEAMHSEQDDTFGDENVIDNGEGELTPKANE